MENQSQFSLERALEAWRRQLADAGIDVESLCELEGHLRESISRIQGTGISEEDAFAIGTYRLGQAGPLAAEFSKARPEKVWFERFLWMLIGAQVVAVAAQLAHFLRNLISIPEVLIHRTGLHTFERFTPISWISYYLIQTAMLYLAFRAFQSRRWVRQNWIEALCRQPGKCCAVIALASLIVGLVSSGSSLLPMIVESWWSNWINSGIGGIHFGYGGLLRMLAISSANALLVPLLTFWFLRHSPMARKRAIPLSA